MLKLRSEGLDWRVIDDEVVAVNLTTSFYLAVNKTGRLLWPSLEAGTERDELVRQLVTQFDISPAQAEADVDAFVEALHREGMLEPSGSDGA